MSFDQESVYDEELDGANPDVVGDDDDDDDDDGEEKAPPLYICIHRNEPWCNDLHPHPRTPTVYDNVTKDTPCRYCGHTGTLRRAN